MRSLYTGRMFEDALCLGFIQGKANCAQALDVEAWIRSVWERLSVGEIAVKTEVVLFHDAIKGSLALAREKKVGDVIEPLTHFEA